MAVNDSNENQKSASQQQQAQQQAQQGAQQQTAQQGGQQGHIGMGNINNLLQRSGSYDDSETRSTDALKALGAARVALVEAQKLDDEFELIRFDRDTHRVGLSSILVTRTLKLNGRHSVSVRTLILDNSAVQLRPRVFHYGNNRYELTPRVQDVYNENYWGKIDTFFKTKFGADTLVYQAGPQAIPTEFDFKDESAVARLLVNSVNRCDDIIARIRGEVPFTVSNVKRADERLTSRIDFSGDPRHDLVGNPVRADIVISMNRQSATAAQEDDFYERETSFNSVSGFINLEYVPTPPVQQGWGVQQQQQPQAPFVPTFVITDVSQADWIKALTLELWFLALSNAYRVTAGSSWLRSLMPQVGKKGIDYRDVGALTYLTQQKKLETKSDSFTESDFVEMMMQLVRPNPAFLIDVNPVGEHSSVEQFFIDAAIPNANQKRAIERLAQAVDNLTGGVFKTLFDHNTTPIILPYNQEVHLGHYVGDGMPRDIRDLDVLAALNMSEGNVPEFINWYQTYCDLNEPNEIRLQRREGIERQYLSKFLKITGRAHRLMFTPEFIQALDAATAKAGVQVDLENVTTIMGGQRFTGNTTVSNYVVSHNAQLNYGAQGTASAGVTYSGIPGGRLY